MKATQTKKITVRFRHYSSWWYQYLFYSPLDYHYVLKRKQDMFFLCYHAKHWDQLLHYFSQIFSSYLFWLKIYPFPVMIIFKRFEFWNSLQIFSYFYIILRHWYRVLQAFIIVFIDSIYCCCFVFYQIQSITIQFNLWHL